MKNSPRDYTRAAAHRDDAYFSVEKPATDFSRPRSFFNCFSSFPWIPWTVDEAFLFGEPDNCGAWPYEVHNRFRRNLLISFVARGGNGAGWTVGGVEKVKLLPPALPRAPFPESFGIITDTAPRAIPGDLKYPSLKFPARST